MAKKDKFEKTNAMRMLDAAGVSYECHVYDGSVALSGIEVARFLGQDPDRVFKTLVSVGRSGWGFGRWRNAGCNGVSGSETMRRKIFKKVGALQIGFCHNNRAA